MAYAAGVQRRRKREQSLVDETTQERVVGLVMLERHCDRKEMQYSARRDAAVVALGPYLECVLNSVGSRWACKVYLTLVKDAKRDAETRPTLSMYSTRTVNVTPTICSRWRCGSDAGC
jgi:hypothetical protein